MLSPDAFVRRQATATGPAESLRTRVLTSRGSISLQNTSQLRTTTHRFHIFGSISGGATAARTRTRTRARTQTRVSTTFGAFSSTSGLSSECLHTGLVVVCKYLVSNYLGFIYLFIFLFGGGGGFHTNANMKVMPAALPVAASSRSCPGSE